jgi:hypothetical protein
MLFATAIHAADAPRVRPPAKSPAKKTAPSKAPAAVTLPEAAPDQLDAAKLVYYGRYDCEFNQSIDIVEHAKAQGYVDVRFGKTIYVMKPVLSSTGAVRLEDVKGQTLMVQIANKSMLLDVKAGRRLVDECVSPKQRELIEAAAKAKEAEAAALAAAQAAAAAASAAAQAASAASAAAQAASSAASAASAAR